MSVNFVIVRVKLIYFVVVVCFVLLHILQARELKENSLDFNILVSTLEKNRQMFLKIFKMLVLL
jgi:hypothetical protein